MLLFLYFIFFIFYALIFFPDDDPTSRNIASNTVYNMK